MRAGAREPSSRAAKQLRAAGRAGGPPEGPSNEAAAPRRTKKNTLIAYGGFWQLPEPLVFLPRRDPSVRRSSLTLIFPVLLVDVMPVKNSIAGQPAAGCAAWAAQRCPVPRRSGTHSGRTAAFQGRGRLDSLTKPASALYQVHCPTSARLVAFQVPFDSCLAAPP